MKPLTTKDKSILKHKLLLYSEMNITEIQAVKNAIDWPAWVQATAAVIAAVGLVFNLIYQRRYTRAQIKIAERDYERYLDETMPGLEFTLKYDRLTESGTVGYKIVKNPIYELNIQNAQPKYIKLLGQKSTSSSKIPNTQAVGNSLEFSFLLLKENLEEFSEKEGKVFILNMSFSDKTGVKYQQNVNIYLNEGAIHPLVPKRLILLKNK